MQAIGFLSRREHSRQELRTKLLDTLRKRAREDAALAAAAMQAVQALEEARAATPSNGIDDAFAPPMPSPRPASSGVARSDAPAVAHNADDAELADPEATVDELLDWLAANNYLSEARFVESRVHARAAKQGGLRIKLELSRHGLALDAEQVAALRETEFARAQSLWQRKFGEVATEARERARQARFLAARGFAADVVRRVVGGLDDD